MAKVRLASILEESPVSMTDEGGGGGGTPPKTVKVAVKKTVPEEPTDPDYLSLKDSKNLKSGKFKKEHIVNLLKAAKATGVDPNQLLALTWQESNLGGTKEQILGEQKRRQDLIAQGKRPGRGSLQVNLGQMNDGIDDPEELANLSTKTGISTNYLAPAIMLRNKLKYAKQLGFSDPALQLQSYNGYGKLKMQPGDKYYGQAYPQGGVIDMRKTPLYGKRLLELRSDIQKNKDIQDLLKTL